MFVRFTTDFVIIQLSTSKCQLFFSFFCFIFYHFSFDTIEQTSAEKRIVWILFPATDHTTYIIQHFRINQKNLRIAPKIFLIIFYIEDMSYTIP